MEFTGNAPAGVAIRPADDLLGKSGAAASLNQIAGRCAKHRIGALPFPHERQHDVIAHSFNGTKLHPRFERRGRGRAIGHTIHDPSQGDGRRIAPPHGSAGRASLLHYDEIVLLQVQLFIRHDKEFGGAFALEGFNALPFLILKQSSDGRMGAHDDPLLFVCSSDFSDLAEDLIRHRRRRLGIPSAFAVMAGFGQRAQQILAHALAGDFNQSQVGNPGDPGPRLVATPWHPSEHDRPCPDFSPAPYR